MAETSDARQKTTMIKVVYFDEESLADTSGNVRKLEKLVDEVISLVLVQAILSDVPATDTPNTKDAA